MNTASQQFHRLTIEEVKSDWESGVCSAAMYLLGIVRVSRAIGWDFKIESVEDFCNEWGIPRRSFYRAKNQLINAGLLEEEVLGAIVIRLCATNGTVSATNGTVSATNGTVSATNGTVSATNGTAITLKRKLGADSGSPTDLIQTSFRSDPEKKEPEIFSNSDFSEISTNGQNLEPEKTPPQPRPASTAQYTHPADKMGARFARGKEAVSYRSVKQWHVGNSSKIDPEFIAYLQSSDLISFNKAEPPSAERVEQWLSIAYRTTPEGQDRLELATKAWYTFAAERRENSARREAMARRAESNDPDNNAAYKRFSEALEKTGKLRCVVQSFDHFGLRISIEYKGKTLVSSHTFSRASLTLVFVELRKVDKRWKTEEALADRLGLRDFFEMCSFEAVA